MFEITPSDEFSAWFESLPPGPAEEVACSLDLLAEAGVALGPSRTSRALLWYDGVGDALPATDDSWLQGRTLASALSSFEDVRELLLWQREVVRCLDSEAFQQRLAQLDAKAASVALLAIGNLKNRLSMARNRINLAQRVPPLPRALPPSAFSVLTPREERVLEQRFGPLLSVKDGFFDVLRLVGLEPAQALNSPSGLCELTIVSTEPKLRVLFGLDAPGQRIVVLLGEPLTRQYYGDSVRLAEQRWHAYCAGALGPPAKHPEP